MTSGVAEIFMTVPYLVPVPRPAFPDLPWCRYRWRTGVHDHTEQEAQAVKTAL